MLTDDRPTTPRPRPPAKARRAASRATTPALPPGAPLFISPTHPSQSDATFLSPTRLTGFGAEDKAKERVDFPLSPLSAAPAITSDWTDAASREELRQLLEKAESTIKERESELEWTSTIAKNLYEGNVALKSKHDALLARIPSASSPSASATSSPRRAFPSLSINDDDPFNSSPIERTADKSPLHFQPIQRVSVSSSDIALLADQNMELLSKIENLEAESASADLAGKRKLRKLEQEISNLREELERTQKHSERLETQVKARAVETPTTIQEEEEDEAYLKRKEREERVRAIRGRTESEGAWGAPAQFRDFAPPGGGLLSPVRRPTSKPFRPSGLKVVTRRASLQGIARSSSGEGGSAESGEAAGAKTAVNGAPPMRFPSLPSPPGSDSSDEAERTDSHAKDEEEEKKKQQDAEREVVSRLMAKIKELEETNAQIVSQQKETNERLVAVQRDSEQFRRVYDYVNDKKKIELELVGDDEEGEDEEESGTKMGSGLPSPPNYPRTKAMRFTSLRKTLERKPAERDVFAPAPGPARVRKSLVGLFESQVGGHHRDEDEEESGAPPEPKVVVEAAAESVAVFSPSPRPVDTWPGASFGLAPSSGPAQGLHSLGSELGSEYGDEPLGAGEDHTRHESLYTLMQLQGELSVPGSGSGTPAPGDSEIPPSPSPSAVELLADEGHFAEHSSAHNTMDRESVRRMQKRMSQTLRDRSGRWSEARFGGLGIDSERTNGVQSRQSYKKQRSVATASTTSSATPTKSRYQMMNEFVQKSFASNASSAGERESTVHVDSDGESELGGAYSAASYVSSRSRRSRRRRDAEEEEEELAAEEPPSSALTLGSIPEDRPKGVAHVVMEAYLWVQFAVIIGVFVFSMVKKGPRVLNEVTGSENRRRR